MYFSTRLLKHYHGTRFAPSKRGSRWSVGLGLLVLCCAMPLRGQLAQDWQRIPGARLIETDFADGDSFMVKMNGQKEVVRLYYVDAPETITGSETDNRRLREQARHFGIERPGDLLAIGRLATMHVKQRLQEPFTVHTVGASALGRSRQARIYVLIETHDGKDLGAELVSLGLARVHGVQRRLPDGTTGEEHAEKLKDLEFVAAMQRRGAWKFTDPDRLAMMREQERSESRELRAFGAFSNLAPGEKLDVNRASLEDLQQISGIGPTLAQRIIDARPFGSVDELERVRGIGPKVLESSREMLKVDSN